MILLFITSLHFSFLSLTFIVFLLLQEIHINVPPKNLCPVGTIENQAHREKHSWLFRVYTLNNREGFSRLSRVYILDGRGFSRPSSMCHQRPGGILRDVGGSFWLAILKFQKSIKNKVQTCLHTINEKNEWKKKLIIKINFYWKWFLPLNSVHFKT
jgi:hypothetical protein